MDNTNSFLESDVPDSSLYRDDIHLNPKGGSRLGTNIRKKLCEVLHIPYTSLVDAATAGLSDESISAGQRNHPNRNFGTGRNHGRSEIDRPAWTQEPYQEWEPYWSEAARTSRR